MKFYLQYYSGKLINWYRRNLTAKGRKYAREQKERREEAKYFGEAMLNLQEHVAETKKTGRAKLMADAKKKTKAGKIVAFDRGKSLGKSKLSNHQLSKSVEGQNRDTLKESGLKINHKTLTVEDA